MILLYTYNSYGLIFTTLNTLEKNPHPYTRLLLDLLIEFLYLAF